MKIQIPKPCQEKWQEMKQVENGRFCGLCQKVIPDFTNKNDRDIVNYIKKNILLVEVPVSGQQRV